MSSEQIAEIIIGAGAALQEGGVRIPLDLPAGTVITVTITITIGPAEAPETAPQPQKARYMGQGRGKPINGGGA